VGVRILKTGAEFFVHLIRRPGDAWADCRGDPLALRAELLHRFNRGVGDSGDRASPAGVLRSDSPGLLVREENGSAIGSEHADTPPRQPRHASGPLSKYDRKPSTPPAGTPG